MEKENSMSDRILHTLETHFHNDPELKEFSIICTEENIENKSPVVYNQHYHTLGLKSWCIKYIYQHAYTQLITLRKQLHERKKKTLQKDINYLLIGALLINPNVTTFWNMKRELIENDLLSVEEELTFTKIVLTYKSKSNETFAYRKWLLKRITNNNLEFNTNLLENELDLAEMTVNKAQNNYHGWTHRLWCMQNLTTNICNLNDLVQRELDFSYNWINTNVSQHVGYRYRQFLFELIKSNNIQTIYEKYYKYVVKQLLVIDNNHNNILLFLFGKRKFSLNDNKSSNSYVNYICLLLFDLFHTVDGLNTVFPNHETIWYHRRYLVYHLFKSIHDYHNFDFKFSSKLIEFEDKQEDENICDSLDVINYKFCNQNGEKGLSILENDLNIVKSCFLYQLLIENETKLICNNSKVCDFTKKYVRWLKLFLNFDDKVR